MLTSDQFEPHLGKTAYFKAVDTHEAIHSLTLSEVSKGRPAPFEDAPAPFILIFSGSKTSEVMAEGLYECVIEGGPTGHIYVSPIFTPHPAHQNYQSVFN